MPPAASTIPPSLWALVEHLDVVLNSPSVAWQGGNKVGYIPLRDAIGKVATHPSLTSGSLLPHDTNKKGGNDFSESTLRKVAKTMLRVAAAAPATVISDNGQTNLVPVPSASGLVHMLASATGRIAIFEHEHTTATNKDPASKSFLDIIVTEAGIIVTTPATNPSSSTTPSPAAATDVNPSILIFLGLTCQAIRCEEDDERCLEKVARCEAKLLLASHKVFSSMGLGGGSLHHPTAPSKAELPLPAWVTGLALPHMLLTTHSAAATRTDSTGSTDSPPPTRRHEVPDRGPFKRPSIDLTTTLKDASQKGDALLGGGDHSEADEIGSPVAQRDNRVAARNFGLKVGQMFASVDVKSMLSLKKELKSLSVANQRATSANTRLSSRNGDSTRQHSASDQPLVVGKVRSIVAKFNSWGIGGQTFDSEDGRSSAAQSGLGMPTPANKGANATNPPVHNIMDESQGFMKGARSLFGKLAFGYVGRISKADSRTLNSTGQWKDQIGGLLGSEDCDGIATALGKLLSSFYFIQQALATSAQQSLRRQPSGEANIRGALVSLFKLLQGSVCGLLCDVLTLRLYAQDSTKFVRNAELDAAVANVLLMGPEMDIRMVTRDIFDNMGIFAPPATPTSTSNHHSQSQPHSLLSALSKDAAVSRHFISLSFTLYSMLGSILTTTHTSRIRTALKMLKHHGGRQTTSFSSIRSSNPTRQSTHVAAVLDRALFQTFGKPGHIVAFSLMLDRPHISYPPSLADGNVDVPLRHALPADAQDDFLLLWASVMGSVIMPFVGYRFRHVKKKDECGKQQKNGEEDDDTAAIRSKFLWEALDPSPASAAQIVPTIETLLTALSSYLVSGAVGGAAVGTPLASVVQAAVQCFPLVVEALDIAFAVKEEEEERYELLRLLHGRVQRYDFGTLELRVIREAATSQDEVPLTGEQWAKLETQLHMKLQTWVLLERSLRKACKEAFVICRGACVNIIHHALEVTDVVFSLVNNHHLVSSLAEKQRRGSVGALLAEARLTSNLGASLSPDRSGAPNNNRTAGYSDEDTPPITVLAHLNSLLSHVFLAHQNSAVGTAITHYTREMLVTIKDEESDSITINFPGIYSHAVDDNAASPSGENGGRSMRSSSAATSHHDLHAVGSPTSMNSEDPSVNMKSNTSFNGCTSAASERPPPRVLPLAAASIALASPLDFLQHFDSDSEDGDAEEEKAQSPPPVATNTSRKTMPPRHRLDVHKRPRAFSISSHPSATDDDDREDSDAEIHHRGERSPSIGVTSTGTAPAKEGGRSNTPARSSVQAAESAELQEKLAMKISKHRRKEDKEELRLRNATVSLLRLLRTSQKVPTHSAKRPAPSAILNTADISLQSTFYWPTFQALRAGVVAEKCGHVRGLYSRISSADEEEFLFSCHGTAGVDPDSESDLAAQIRHMNGLAVQELISMLHSDRMGGGDTTATHSTEGDKNKNRAGDNNAIKVSKKVFEEPLPRLTPGFALLPHHHLHQHRTRLVRHYRGVHRFYLTKLRSWLDDRNAQKKIVITKLKAKLASVLHVRKAESTEVDAFNGDTTSEAQMQHVLTALEATDNGSDLRDSLLRTSQQHEPESRPTGGSTNGSEVTEAYRCYLQRELTDIAVLQKQLKVLSDPKPLFTFKDYASHDAPTTAPAPPKTGFISLESTLGRRELANSFGTTSALGYSGLLTARSAHSGNSGWATPGRFERLLGSSRVSCNYSYRSRQPIHTQTYFHDDHPLDFMLDPYQGCVLTVLATSASYIDDGDHYPIDETGDMVVNTEGDGGSAGTLSDMGLNDDDDDEDPFTDDDDDDEIDIANKEAAVLRRQGDRLMDKVIRLLSRYNERTHDSFVETYREGSDNHNPIDNYSVNSVFSEGDDTNEQGASTRQPSEAGSTSSGTHSPKMNVHRGFSGNTFSCDSRNRNENEKISFDVQFDKQSGLERRVRRYWLCQRHLQRLSVLMLSREVLNLVDEVVGMGNDDRAEAGHDWLKYPRGIRPEGVNNLRPDAATPTVELSSCASLLSLFFPPPVVTTSSKADTTTIPFSFSPSLELLSTCAHLYSPLYARPKWKLTYFRFLYILFLQQYLSKAFAARPHEIIGSANGEDGGDGGGSDVGGRDGDHHRGATAYDRHWQNYFCTSQTDMEPKWSYVPSPHNAPKNPPASQLDTLMHENKRNGEFVAQLVTLCRHQAVNAYHVRAYLRPLQRCTVAKATQSLVSKLLSTLRRMVEVDDESAILTTSDELESKTAEEVRSVVEAQRAARQGRHETHAEDDRRQQRKARRGNDQSGDSRKKRKKRVPEWKREAELAVNRAKAAAKRTERTSVRDKAFQMGIVYTLVKEIDLEHTIRELRDQQVRRKQKQRHSIGGHTSIAGSPKESHGGYRFPAGQDLDGTAASSSVGGDTAPLYDGARRASNQFGESGVFGATAATATTAAFGRTAGTNGTGTGTLNTDRRFHWGSDTPTPLPSHRENPLTVDNTPTRSHSPTHAHPTSDQFDPDHSSPPVHEEETLPPRPSPFAGGGIPKLALHLAPPPLYYTSSGDTAAATDAQMPTEGDESEIETKSVKTEFTAPNSPHKVVMGIPKLALNLAPPPLYYTSSGDTAAATDAQMPTEDATPVPVAPAPTGGLPKGLMGIPKLALHLAPPPLYYTSSGDTAAATDAQMPAEDGSVPPIAAIPVVASLPVVSGPKVMMSIPKLALNLAPPPLYYTSSGDTAAATDAQMPTEDFTLHTKDEPLTVAPKSSPPPLKKMGIPKLALNLAPPPLYYTSSGDTAAATDAQMPVCDSVIEDSPVTTSPVQAPMRMNVPSLNLAKRFADIQAGGSGPVSQRQGKGGLNTGRRPPDSTRSVGWDDTMNTVVEVDPSSPPINSPKPNPVIVPQVVADFTSSITAFGGGTPISPATSSTGVADPAPPRTSGGGPAVPPLPISILKRDSVAGGGMTSGSARGAGYFSQRGDVSARSGNSTARRKILMLGGDSDGGGSGAASTSASPVPTLPSRPQLLLPLKKLDVGTSKLETPPSTTDLSPRMGQISARKSLGGSEMSGENTDAGITTNADSGIHSGFQAFVTTDLKDSQSNIGVLYPLLGPTFLKPILSTEHSNNTSFLGVGGPGGASGRSVSLLASPSSLSDRPSRVGRLPMSPTPGSFAMARGTFPTFDQSTTFSQSVSPRAKSLRGRGLSLRRGSDSTMFGDGLSSPLGLGRSRGSVVADTQLYPIQLLLNPTVFLEHQRTASRSVYANADTHAELLCLLLTLLVRGVNGIAAAAQASSELAPSVPEPMSESAISEAVEKAVAEARSAGGAPRLSKTILKALRPSLSSVLPSLGDALLIQDSHKRSKGDRNVQKIKKLIQRNSTLGTLDGRYVAAYAMLAGTGGGGSDGITSPFAKGGKGGGNNDSMLSSRSTTGGAGLGQSRMAGQNILFPIHRHVAHPLNKEVVALMGRKVQQDNLNPGLTVLVRLLVGPEDAKAAPTDVSSFRRRSVSHADDSVFGGSPAISFHCSPQIGSGSSANLDPITMAATNGSFQATATLLSAYVKQQVQQCAKLNFGDLELNNTTLSADVLQKLLMPKPSSSMVTMNSPLISDGSPLETTRNMFLSNTLSDTLSGTAKTLVTHVVEVLRGAALSATMAGELLSEGLKSSTLLAEAPTAVYMTGASSLPDFRPRGRGISNHHPRPATGNKSSQSALIQNMIAGLYVGLNSSSSSSNAFRQKRSNASKSNTGDRLDLDSNKHSANHANNKEEAMLWEAILAASDDPSLEARKIGAGAFGTVIASQLAIVPPSLLMYPSQSPSQFYESVAKTLDESLTAAAAASRNLPKPKTGRQLRFFLCDDDDPENNVVIPRSAQEKIYEFEILTRLITQCRGTLNELGRLVPDEDDEDGFTQEEVDVQVNQIQAVLTKLVAARKALVAGADGAEVDSESAFGYGGYRTAPSSQGLPLAIKLISLPSHPDDRNAIFGLHAEVLAMIRYMKCANNTDASTLLSMSKASQLIEGPHAAPLTVDHACEVLDYGCTKSHLYAVMPRYPLTAKQWRERIDPTNQRSRLKVLEPEAGCESDEEVSSEEEKKAFAYDSEDSDETPEEHRARVQRRAQIRRRVRRLESVFEAQEATRLEETKKSLLHLATEHPTPIQNLVTPCASPSPPRNEPSPSSPSPASFKNNTAPQLTIDVAKIPNPTMITMFPVLATMFLQMLDSIIALHEECSVVHYDIKCDNFFLDFDPTDRGESSTYQHEKTVAVRLGDFGECYFNSHASAKRSSLHGSKAGKRKLSSKASASGETLRRMLLNASNVGGRGGSIVFNGTDATSGSSGANRTTMDLALETLHALAADEDGSDESDGEPDHRQGGGRGGDGHHESEEDDIGSGEKYESLDEDEDGSTTPVTDRRRHSTDSGSISLSSDDEREDVDDDGSDFDEDYTSDDGPGAFDVAEQQLNNILLTTGWHAQQYRREKINVVEGRTAQMTVDLMQSSTPGSPAIGSSPLRRKNNGRTPRSARISSRGSDDDHLGMTATSKRIAEMNIQRDCQFSTSINLTDEPGPRGIRPLELSSARIQSASSLPRSGSIMALNSARNQQLSARSGRDRNHSMTGFRRNVGTTPTTAALLSSRARNPAMNNVNNIQNSYLQQLSARSTNNVIVGSLGKNNNRQQLKQQQSTKLDERYARGTEAIRPPELLLPHKYLSDRRRRAHRTGYESDVWACGCLLFELLTGDFLFREEHFAKLLHRVTKEREGELLEEKHREMVNNDADVMTFLKFTLCRDPQRRPLLSEVRKRFLALTRKKLSAGGWTSTLAPFLSSSSDTGTAATPLQRVPPNRPSMVSASLKLYDVVRNVKGVASAPLPSLRRANLLPIECCTTRLNEAVQKASHHKDAGAKDGPKVITSPIACESVIPLSPTDFLSGFLPITHSWLSQWLAHSLLPTYHRTRLWRLSLSAAASNNGSHGALLAARQNNRSDQHQGVDYDVSKVWLSNVLKPLVMGGGTTPLTSPSSKGQTNKDKKPQITSLLETILGACLPVGDSADVEQIVRLLAKSFTSSKPAPIIKKLEYSYAVASAGPTNTGANTAVSAIPILDAFVAQTEQTPSQEQAMFALPPHHGIRILDGAVASTATTSSSSNVKGATTVGAPDMEALEELVHERLDELCSWSEHVHSHRVKTTQVDSSAATNSALRRIAADDLHTCDDDELPLAASAAAPFDQVSTPDGDASGLPPPPTSTSTDLSASNHHHSHGAPFVHLSPYLTVYTLPFYAYHNHVVNNESATARVQMTEDREAAIAKVSAELEDAAAMESAALQNELFSRQLLMAHVECVKDSNVTNAAVIVTRPGGAVLGVTVKDLPRGTALLQCPDATHITLSSNPSVDSPTTNTTTTTNASKNSFPTAVGLPNVPVEAEAALEAFLGGLYAPLNLANLQEMGYTHILNFAPVSPAESLCISGHFSYLDMYSCFNGSNPSPSPVRHGRDCQSAAHSPLSSATPTSDRSVSQPADEDSTADDDGWDRCLDKETSFEIPKTNFISGDANLAGMRQYHRQFTRFFTKGGAIDRFCAAARASGGRVLVIPAPPLDSDTAAAIRSHHTERLNRQVSSMDTLRTAIAALATAKKLVDEERWIGMMLQRILSLFAAPSRGTHGAVLIPLGTSSLTAVLGDVEKHPALIEDASIVSQLSTLFAPLFQPLLDGNDDNTTTAKTDNINQSSSTKKQPASSLSQSACSLKDANPTLTWLILSMISDRLGSSLSTTYLESSSPKRNHCNNNNLGDTMGGTISTVLGDTLVSESTTSSDSEGDHHHSHPHRGVGFPAGGATPHMMETTLSSISGIMPSVVADVQQLCPSVMWDSVGHAAAATASLGASMGTERRQSLASGGADINILTSTAEAASKTPDHVQRAADAVIELLTNSVVLRQASRSSPAHPIPTALRPTIVSLPSSSQDASSRVVHCLSIPSKSTDFPSLLLQCEMMLRGYYAVQNGYGSRAVFEQMLTYVPSSTSSSPQVQPPHFHGLMRGLALDQHTLCTARSVAGSVSDLHAVFSATLPTTLPSDSSPAPSALNSALSGAVSAALTLASISLEQEN